MKRALWLFCCLLPAAVTGKWMTDDSVIRCADPLPRLEQHLPTGHSFPSITAIQADPKHHTDILLFGSFPPSLDL